jgi:hypothetical protein
MIWRSHRAAISLLGLATTLLSLWIHTPSVAAQESGSLIIGVARCPAGYTGENYAGDCTTPDVGIAFTIATPNTGNTETTTSRGDGLATFSLAPYDLDPTGPDIVSVGEPVSATGEYAVFCTKNDGEPLDFDYETIDVEPGGPLLGNSYAFDTGDNIACEWYNIPVAGGSDAGQLPRTGAGSVTTGDSSQSRLLVSLVALLVLAGLSTRALRYRAPAQSLPITPAHTATQGVKRKARS